MGGAENGHGGEGGHGLPPGDFRNRLWSMSGGPYCRPKHWKRNTAIAMAVIFLICIPIAMKSAELEDWGYLNGRLAFVSNDISPNVAHVKSIFNTLDYVQPVFSQCTSA